MTAAQVLFERAYECYNDGNLSEADSIMRVVLALASGRCLPQHFVLMRVSCKISYKAGYQLSFLTLQLKNIHDCFQRCSAAREDDSSDDIIAALLWARSELFREVKAEREVWTPPASLTSQESSGMSEKQDPFQILNISKTSSAREIRQAYHKLALKWHPDKHEDKQMSALGTKR